MAQVNHARKSGNDKNNEVLGTLVFKVSYEDYRGATGMTAIFQQGRADIDDHTLDEMVYLFTQSLDYSVQLGDNCPVLNLSGLKVYEFFGYPLDDNSDKIFIKEYEY